MAFAFDKAPQSQTFQDTQTPKYTILPVDITPLPVNRPSHTINPDVLTILRQIPVRASSPAQNIPQQLPVNVLQQHAGQFPPQSTPVLEILQRIRQTWADILRNAPQPVKLSPEVLAPIKDLLSQLIQFRQGGSQ